MDSIDDVCVEIERGFVEFGLELWKYLCIITYYVSSRHESVFHTSIARRPLPIKKSGLPHTLLFGTSPFRLNN